MPDFNELQDDELIDLLAEYTQKYTRLFHNFSHINSDMEYQACKEILLYLIAEVGKRGMLEHKPRNVAEKDNQR